MTLYALRPDPETGDIDDDSEVVEQSKYGWEFLDQAIALWRLVDEPRADRIAAIKQRLRAAAGGGELRIAVEDQRELAGLLEGIEAAIEAAGIVDGHWRVPTDRLEDLEALQRRVPAMDLNTERPLQSKTSALGEIMINAGSIRNFLNDSASAGYIIVFS